MKNLLVICHGFPPYYGGAEHAAYYQAREAAAAGLAVTVVTSDIGGRLPPEEDMDGFRVLRVPARKRAWTRHTVGELVDFRRSALRAVPGLIDTFRPDHVLAHFTLPSGDVARLLCVPRGLPFTVVLHGSDVPGYQPRRFGLLYPLVRPWVRRVWEAADRVVAVSQPLADLAHRTWPGGAVTVIGNGVDTALFRPAVAYHEAGGDDRLRLLVVSQLVHRKGLHHLADAVDRLSESTRRRVSLDIFGTGPCEPALRHRFGRTGVKVSFRGVAARADLAAVHRESDIFVLPSLEEGLPLAALEAMASGLPVVASAVGGLPDLVRSGFNGVLVPPGDDRALGEALETLAGDAQRRCRLGEAARQTAEQHAWRQVWRQYAQLIAPAEPAPEDRP